MFRLFITIGFVFCVSMVFSQGKLFLVGGGEEEEKGWSDLPYTWAVSEAPNKKIAIIGFEEMDRWLESYFVKLGARRIQTFQIETEEYLQDQSVIDSLMNYDGWFFSGGHQIDFYRFIKGSLLEKAIIQKYNSGGVIGGAGGGAGILSEIIFTGQNGEAYSNDCLKNVDHPSIVLANDFLPFLEGFLIEPHFSEQGKIGRLISFMANWWLQSREIISGLGIDEKTAICIDSAGVGKVFGTGTVSLVLNDVSKTGFRIREYTPQIDSIRLVKMVQGNSFDFISWELDGFGNYYKPTRSKLDVEYKVILSGSNDLSDNQAFLDSFTVDYQEEVLIITQKMTPSVEAVDALIRARGVGETSILATGDPKTWDVITPAEVEKIDRFLFIENFPDQLLIFLFHGQLGPTIQARLFGEGIFSGFIGDDARLAGQIFIENHRTDGASSRGELVFREGLNLISSAIISSNSFRNNNYYENAMTGIPYSLLKDSLENGFWLSGNSFLTYQNDGLGVKVKGFGSQPTLLLHNPGTRIGWTPKVNDKLRNQIGFEKMQLILLDSTGFEVAELTFEEEEGVEVNPDWFAVYPNPFRETLNVFFYGSQSGIFTFQLLDSDGKEVKSITKALKPNEKFLKISVPDLSAGVYVLLIRDSSQRIIKQIRVLH